MVTTRGRPRKAVERISPSPVTSSARRSKSKKASQKNLSSRNRRTNELKEEPPITSPECWEEYSDEETTRTSFHTKDSDSDIELFKSESEDEVYADDSDIEYPQTSVRQSRGAAKPEESTEEAFCPWIEISPDELPSLELPQSSTDLLIENHLLFDVLEIYQVCQVYYRTIQISPFLFEDFLCSLRSTHLTKLIAEIHIAFIKLLLRDDEDEQITLSVQDTNNSFNIMIHLLEPLTYAEVLRQYVESDPSFPKEVLEALQSNYPFVDVQKKILVLKWLCERFLYSATFKKIIKHEGKLYHDEHCRECGKPGDVLLCDGCSACYHLACAELDEIPSGEWLCKVCQIHQIRGVLDCLNYDNKVSSRQPLRMKPIGYDRHSRLYWFLVRRIFVQDLSNGQVYYYSTLPQVYELVSRMDPQLYELQLCQAFKKRAEQIAEQMNITLELTDTKRSMIVEGLAGSREIPEPYLHVDNADRMSRIYSDLVTNQTAALSNESGNDEDEENISVIKKLQHLLCIEDGILVETFWTGGLTETQLLDYRKRYNDAHQQGEESITSLLKERTLKMHRGFRLGFSDGGYRSYENQYIVNEYAKSPYLRAKDRDRKKYLSLRFSLTDDGTFDWPKVKEHGMFKSAEDVATIIQHSLRRMIQKIPDELVHRLWKPVEKEKFMHKLQNATTVESLRFHLLQYEKAVRKPIFSNVWWNSLGHTRLQRITPADREYRQELESRKKKEERELLQADPYRFSNIVWVKYSSLGGPPKHNIWKMKDEQYRVNGYKKLGGWLWISSTRVYRRVNVPAKPPCGITTSTNHSELTTNEAKKAFRLEKLVQKLNHWRKESEVSHKTSRLHCYSSSCHLAPSVAGVRLTCYSPTCSSITTFSQTMTSTSAVVKAYDPAKKIAQSLNAVSKEIMGEGKPFSFPKPFGYKVRATGKRSIFVLPPPILRRVARLSSKVIIPGFHPTAKANFTVWNYPCSRPLFDNCWRYITLNSSSLAAIALQFRIMYACIRWTDMKPGADVEDERDPRVITHHPDYDEIREVVGHKEHPPDGYYEQYKLKLEQYYLEDAPDREGGDDSENYRGFGGVNLRARKRKQQKDKRDSLKQRDPRKARIKEQWIDGVDLRLFEIKRYWQAYHRRFYKQQVPINVGVFSRALSTQKSLQDTEYLNRSRLVLDKALNGTPNQTRDMVIRPQQRLTNVSTQRASLPLSSTSYANGYSQETRRPPSFSAYQTISTKPTTSDIKEEIKPGYNLGLEPPVKRIRLDTASFAQLETQQKEFIMTDEHGVKRTFIAVKPQDAGINITSQMGGETINSGRATTGISNSGVPKMIRLVPFNTSQVRLSQPIAQRSPVNNFRPSQAAETSQVAYNGQPTLIRMSVRPAQSPVFRQNSWQSQQPVRSTQIIQKTIPAQSYAVETDPSLSGSVSRASSTFGDHDYGSQQHFASTGSNITNYQRYSQPNYAHPGRMDESSYDNTAAQTSQMMFEDIEPAPKSEYRLFLEEKLRKTLEDASNLTSYGSISAREQFEDVDDFERDLISYETKLPVINKRAIYGSSEESRQKKKPKLYDEILANESKYVKSIETVASHISSASPKVLHTPKRKKKTVLIDKSQIIESPKSDQSGSAKRPRSRNIRLNGEELQSVLHETEEPVAVAPSKKTQRVGPTLLALALNNKQKVSRSFSETKSTPQQRQQSTKTPKANSSKRKSSITVSPAVYKEDALVATTTTPKRQKSSKCQITEAATPNTTDGSKETPILVKKMDPTKNHCICNTPYDPKKFYIACNVCNRWFHGKCMKMTEKQANDLDSWTCEDCAKELTQELYCLCRQPYDDKRFYIGCDICEDWFHPECLGLTKEKVESSEEFACPPCQQKQNMPPIEKLATTDEKEVLKVYLVEHELDTEEYPILYRIWKELKEDFASWPFLEPVDVKLYPAYTNFVKKPMDLSTVRSKLDKNEYRRLKDFASDIYQIFENARLANEKGSPIWQCAELMEKHFRQHLNTAKEELSQKLKLQSAKKDYGL